MPTENPAESKTRIALITGASRGLGRSTASSLARRGVDVVLTYHSNRAEAENAIATIKELGHKAVALPLDTSNVSSFDGFVRDFGTALRETWGRERFDFLVNNAGTAVHAPSPKRRKRTSTTWSTFISKACSS